MVRLFYCPTCKKELELSVPKRMSKIPKCEYGHVLEIKKEVHRGSRR